MEKKVRKNLEDFEAKIQITAQITRLKVVKSKNKFRTFWEYKSNNSTKKERETDKWITRNSEHFETKNEINADRTWLQFVKNQEQV